MTDNTKALAQALMKTKQSPFVNQEDIDYALKSRERWISSDDLNIYKNLKGLTNDWENHSFKEFVIFLLIFEFYLRKMIRVVFFCPSLI